jgi:hypothetical protein
MIFICIEYIGKENNIRKCLSNPTFSRYAIKIYNAYEILFDFHILQSDIII